MSRKLLSILVLLLLIFGIYNFRQGILDNYVSIYAQDEKEIGRASCRERV